MKIVGRLGCAALLSLLATPLYAQGTPIVHDAEYYILEAQNGEAWAAEDAELDAELAAIKERNGGKPPNIFYILIDDIGFGDLGSETLNALRGYKTPAINEIASEGMRLARMYTEPSCTPTRVAFMTGRQPHRNGMGNTQVDISGFGLADKEVTLAEILSDAGYNTSHVGKWHMGDIREAWPNYQGFDYAAFPIHQQGQLTIFHDDAANEEVSIGIGNNNYDDRYTLDRWFRTDASRLVTGLEGVRNEDVREVHMEPGERWTEAKYHEMNVRYQNQTMEQLRKLAAEDKPFFLQYWPLYPLTGPRTTTEKYTTPNGGIYVEKMKLVDQWIGELMTEMETLGIADNTIVIVMGDNGHFTKYSPQSGYTPMIFRGGKGDTTEGGVRVDAFIRWPGVIEANSVVGDMVHVSDLFTTLARVAGAKDRIPTDRIIDGLDQTALLLNGEGKGRRDYVFLYNITKLEAIIKEQYKLAIPGGSIDNAILADFYDLFRDPQEKYPVSTEIGAWGSAKFINMLQRHLKRKEKYPSEGPAVGMPYEGVENLRPETIAVRDEFLFMQKVSDQ
ncbi:MAG: sulfatase-like hydrolase/transferase [Roseibium sp.]|uniref:sulfatase-like hydrolase/transferase n=1 Tax=Roseibium sp. TaxID=1936156 RepID=UPI001B07A480|nr:sulfatase-like hydrolase/transferase [Roseibium sp.]MBO6893757.1 sulfatase-like hydrolase/transferase [Roseibium sp.]MBO6928578.1 sulfatase-like hydrolase/transferase [Roseibium sp.]